MALVTHSHASLTKIERQEIILSIEYPISFIAVFVDKLQNQESCMHNGWSIYNSNLFSFSFRLAFIKQLVGYELLLVLFYVCRLCIHLLLFLNVFHISGSPWY